MCDFKGKEEKYKFGSLANEVFIEKISKLKVNQ